MKRILLAAILLVVGLIKVEDVKASHAMGVDLSYQHVVGNFYRVTLTYYRDCSGISASSTAWIDFNSPSGCGATFSQSLPLVGTGTEVSPLCAAEAGNSTCSGGSIPGVEQYVYEDLVEFPSECDDWNISFSECCRNDGSGLTTNLVTPTSWDIYVEATLDNTNSLNNSSPQFTTLPVPYICTGQDFTYNHGAYDPDGDSLVYSLVAAQDGPYPGTNIGYNAPATAVNPLVGVANVFDTQTGSIVVNPDGTDELAVMVILVEEYRNGVLIGSTMRDIQVVVRSCTNQQPAEVAGITNQVGGVNIDANSVEVCPGEALSFDIEFEDPNAGDNLTLVDNLGAVIPSSTFTTSGSNPITGSFSWTPTGADAGFHTFTVTVQDDGCPTLGSQVFSYDILVQEGTYAGADQTYCPGGIDPQLSTTGGSVFNWTYFGNGDGSGMAGASVPVNASFSCNPCATPIPNPSSTTTYVVTSNLSSLCKNRDTVTVNYDAGFALTMPSNQTICLNEGVNLPLTHPGGSYTYNWSPNAGLSNPGVQSPLASPSATTTYTATVTDDATGCRNQGTVDVTISGVGPIVYVSNDTNICAGDPITLSANPIVAPGSCGIGSPCGGGTTDYVYGTGTSSSDTYGPYYDGWEDYRIQILFLASELNSVGMVGNTISEIAFDVVTDGGETYNGFNIRMGCTSLDNLTGSFESGLDLVYSNGMGQSVGGTGWDYITLDDAYDWDGTSNLIIEICWDNSSYNFSTSSPVRYHTAAGTKYLYDYADGSSGCSLNSPTTSANRPNMTFRTCDNSGGTFNYIWSGGLASTANPTASPVSSTTYVVDVEDVASGCFGTASVDVTVGAAYSLNPASSTPTICYGNSVNLDANPSGAGPYTYSWSPTTNMIGNFSQTPTATPTGTTKFYVDVDNGGCTRRDSVTVDVLGTPIAAYIDTDSICPGESVQLDVAATPSFCGVTTACGGSDVLLTLGTSEGSTGITPYEGFYHDARMQILYTAADLAALGVTPGVITDIGFRVATNGSTQQYRDFTISMASVSLANLGGFQSGLSTVYGPTNYTVSAIGWQMHTLDSPFSWDGTCDLLVEICFNNSSYTSDDDVNYNTTSYTSVAYAYQDGNATGGCGLTLDGTSSQRPWTRFRVCSATLSGGATYTWTGPVSNSSISNPTSSPTSSATYDVTVDDGSCITTGQARVGVNQESVTVGADNTTRCTGEVANLSSALSDVIPPDCDSYTVSSVAYAWDGAAAGSWTDVSSDMSGDFGYCDATENIPIGFDFDFYCNTYTNVYGNANGYLSFDALTGSGGYYDDIPNATTANNQIAFATEDLVCTAARYRLVGTAPNRIFVFQYGGYHYSVTTELVRVQINLYETTNEIEIMARRIDDDASLAATMTMGIENADGSIGVTVPGRNNANWTAASEGWKFTPDAGATYSWSPTTGLDDATSATPVYTAPDNNSRDFILTVTGGYCEMKDTVTIGCILPIDLLKFDVRYFNSTVYLDWGIFSSEKDAQYFDVERSADGEKFVKVGSIKAEEKVTNYSTIDDKPLEGKSYYRLKIVEKDGSYNYSKVKTVNNDGLSRVNVYPNPSLGSETISIDCSTKGKEINIRFMDVAGREIVNNNYPVENVESHVSISTEHIPEGVYIYKVNTQEGEFYGKIIINK